MIEVDDVRSEASEGLVSGAQESLRPAVDGPDAVDAGHPALGRQDDLLAMRAEHAPDELLVATESIQRRGVEEHHSSVHGREEQPGCVVR